MTGPSPPFASLPDRRGHIGTLFSTLARHDARISLYIRAPHPDLLFTVFHIPRPCPVSTFFSLSSSPPSLPSSSLPHLRPSSRARASTFLHGVATFLLAISYFSSRTCSSPLSSSSLPLSALPPLFTFAFLSFSLIFFSFPSFPSLSTVFICFPSRRNSRILSQTDFSTFFSLRICFFSIPVSPPPSYSHAEFSALILFCFPLPPSPFSSLGQSRLSLYTDLYLYVLGLKFFFISTPDAFGNIFLFFISVAALARIRTRVSRFAAL